MKFILFSILLAISISQSLHLETNDNIMELEKDNINTPFDDTPKHRTKRGIWDIFQKMVITKNLIVDQYTDTRDTLNDVFNMFNSQFADPADSRSTQQKTTTEAPKSSTEDPNDSSEIKTTTEPFRISRYDFGRILGRNFRGLRRLAHIEIQDALNATQYNLADYKAEASKQFANSLAAEKKKQIKAFVKG
ncbi:uncharacterized protein LOC142228073 [Haematobia irritans]|uniref:uncharacterized protein LOC142228073 n=1 Tax=Haematobia irritans TaxID=7368 RepID=UPI003F4FF1F5